jgi:HlyD family secretion protein
MYLIKKHPVLVFSSLVIIIIIGIGFIPRPVLVDTVVVSRDSLVVTIEEEGKTRIIDHYVLSAPVDGYARRIDLDVGDPVNMGQEIVSLEPLRSNVLDPRSRAEAEAKVSASVAALNAAERDVRAAEADAQYATEEAERLKRLFDTGAIPLDRLQQSEAAARRTTARLESARYSVQIAEYEKISAEAVLKYSTGESAEENLETVYIKAPVSGQVLKIHHESEGVVYKGETLIDIGDPLSLEVVVEVLSRDAVRISPGTKVMLSRWGGEEILDGVVRTVEPVGFTKISALGVEEQRVFVIVDITTPKDRWMRLGDSYRIETAFVLWEEENVLQVPSSALFRINDDWALYAMVDEVAELRMVETGKKSGLMTQVLSGIDEGDVIINHPGDNLDEGSRVRSR